MSGPSIDDAGGIVGGDGGRGFGRQGDESYGDAEGTDVGTEDRDGGNQDDDEVRELRRRLQEMRDRLDALRDDLSPDPRSSSASSARAYDFDDDDRARGALLIGASMLVDDMSRRLADALQRARSRPLPRLTKTLTLGSRGGAYYVNAAGRRVVSGTSAVSAPTAACWARATRVRRTCANIGRVHQRVRRRAERDRRRRHHTGGADRAQDRTRDLRRRLRRRDLCCFWRAVRIRRRSSNACARADQQCPSDRPRREATTRSTATAAAA